MLNGRVQRKFTRFLAYRSMTVKYVELKLKRNLNVNSPLKKKKKSEGMLCREIE